MFVVCYCRPLKRKSRHDGLTESVSFDNLNYRPLTSDALDAATAVTILVLPGTSVEEVMFSSSLIS